MKKFQRSSGEYRSQISVITLNMSGKVRALIRRRRALSFENATLMGLRSGLKGGKKRNQHLNCESPNPRCVKQGCAQLGHRDVIILRDDFSNRAQMQGRLALAFRSRPAERPPPDPSAGSQAPIALPWGARVSSTMPPRDRLTLRQCIAETAPEACLAEVLT